MNRLIRWLANDPIHGALTVGFAAGFASFTLELLHRAIDQAAPPYVLLSISLLGVVAVAQSQRCARLLVWLRERLNKCMLLA